MEVSYSDRIHFWGRLWCALAIVMFILYPTAVSIYYGAWPHGLALFKGLMRVVPTFWTVGTIEAFTYTPLLGSGGSYLGFVTGNLANLKVPCAFNAMKIAGVKPGTEEGEVISTIAIAISSIVTTLCIFIGVLLLSRLQPILESELLAPAFANILPSLFGALAVIFLSRNWKIALTPLVFMAALFTLMPSLSRYSSVLVPVGAIVAVAAARVLYRKGVL